MTDKVETDVLRRVYSPHSDGNYIEVGPWPDSPMDTIELRTHGKGAEYFGHINLSMNVDFAEGIAKAILAAVKDLRGGDEQINGR